MINTAIIGLGWWGKTLVKAARERGIETFAAQTLAENKNMLDVFRHTGFPVTSSIEFGTVTLRFPIAPSEAYKAAAEARATRWRPQGKDVVS